MTMFVSSLHCIDTLARAHSGFVHDVYHTVYHAGVVGVGERSITSCDKS